VSEEEKLKSLEIGIHLSILPEDTDLFLIQLMLSISLSQTVQRMRSYMYIEFFGVTASASDSLQIVHIGDVGGLYYGLLAFGLHQQYMLA
jgi:hypothetical protein